MEKKETNLKSIIKTDSELSQIQDLDLLVEKILFEACKVVNADAGSIYIKQREESPQEDTAEKLVIRYALNKTVQKGLPPGEKMVYSIFTLPINETSIAGYCALTKKIINIPDMYHIPASMPYSFNSTLDKMAGYKSVSSLTFPLVTAEQQVMGVIQILNTKDCSGNIVPFSPEDELITTHFASIATMALQRAYLTRAMVLRMIKLAELRDPKETGTHVNRVAGYTINIYDRWAHYQNIPLEERDKFRDILKISSMLHDVGKVAIPDSILKKPGRLTSEEFLIMQEHSSYGAALFDDPQSPIDIMSRDISLTHHENWDGTGYPGWIDPVTRIPIKTDASGKVLGKKGEEIPLTGRIVAIADVFDALCSKRVYKEPWDESRVLEEMRKLSGTKFDPDLIDIFFEVLPNIKQTQEMYPEARTEEN